MSSCLQTNYIFKTFTKSIITDSFVLIFKSYINAFYIQNNFNTILFLFLKKYNFVNLLSLKAYKINKIRTKNLIYDHDQCFYTKCLYTLEIKE